MNQTDQTEEIVKELTHRYGSAEGSRIFMTVMPSVLADFNRMLEKTSGGKQIRETYRLEDGKGTLELKGSLKDGRPQISMRLI